MISYSLCLTAEDTADGTDDNTSVDMLAEEGSMNDNTLKYVITLCGYRLLNVYLNVNMLYTICVDI